MIGQNDIDHERMAANERRRAMRSVFVPAMGMVSRQSCDTDILERLLAGMDSVDPRLLEHGERTARYSVAIGHALDLSGTELVHLHFAGLLHDIGKLTLPREMLWKEAPFSSYEYALMQCHPRSGAEMLTGIPFLRTAALWVAHHHERWDGTGYPYGLRNLLIPLGSRILAVADLFDELASGKEPSKSPRVAMAVLSRAAGAALDPLLVERFLAILTARPGMVEQNDTSR